MSAIIAQIDFWIASVTSKTRWQFVEVRDSDGRVGTGEASLLGRDEAVTLAFERLAPGLIGRSADTETTTRGPIPPDIAAAAIWSAVDQALWDLAAQRRGLPLADVLGRQRASVDAYANINRRTVARTPAAFANSARLAVSRGFAAVKIAPFDEVTIANASLSVARAGLARIEAVRAAVPATCAVYVDCHWRFTPAVAREMVDALADVGAAWYECPIVETDDAGPTLAGLRRAATSRGLILAGREEGVTRAPFQLFADAGAYDVMMPDVKYIGSIREMLETATLLERAGIQFSPHNHTGPIGHAASLAVALAADGCDLLEMQFDETPLFETIVTGTLPEPQGGRIADVQRPGLGCALHHDVIQQYVSTHRVITG